MDLFDWFTGHKPATAPTPVVSAFDDAFDDAFKLTIENEGGYSNKKKDKGGPTNFGVTQATYDVYRVRNGKPKQAVSLVTLDEAKDVYRTLFWNNLQMDQFPHDLALCLFDAAINHRPSVWCKLLQRTVGAHDDGILGPDTQMALHKALESKGEKDVIREYLDHRWDFYDDIVEADPSQLVWLNGWHNRVDHLRKVLT